jgi:hypothetical protein
MIDEIGEVVVDVTGAVLRHAGGFVVDMTVDHIFSRHTARFFHGVGRRVIRFGTVGQSISHRRCGSCHGAKQRDRRHPTGSRYRSESCSGSPCSWGSALAAPIFFDRESA